LRIALRQSSNGPFQIANTWADAFDALLDAYEQIGEHMPILKDYHGVFQGNPDMQRVLGMMFDDIVAFHTEAVRFFSKNSEPAGPD
jgi:hypothetical protein